MNQKLKDYKEDPNNSEEQQIRNIEKEVTSTKKDLSDVDPDVIVAKGDEEAPVSSGGSADALKSLYAKGRKNRELTQRKDAEGTPDVAQLQQLYAWAGQEMPDGATEPPQLDTNKPDRFAEDRGEETEEQYTARKKAEKENPDTGEKLPVSAPPALQQADSDATVEVTILGRTMKVPQQDIDDAGGLSAYQKNRAATIKLQRAATLESKAQLTLKEIEDQRHGVQQDDLSTDGSSDVDIDSLHEEMMDVVVDGTVEEMKEWMAKKLLHPKTPQAAKPTATTTRSPEPQTQSEIQAELKAQFEADRVDANEMMQTEYTDIMADPELLALAQQRFNVLKTNPLNEGRTQKEMARESANFIRNLGKRVGGAYRPNPIEVERQTRVERKRSLPQQSRADQAAPEKASNEKRVPTRREHFLRLRRSQGHQD